MNDENFLRKAVDIGLDSFLDGIKAGMYSPTVTEFGGFLIRHAESLVLEAYGREPVND